MKELIHRTGYHVGMAHTNPADPADLVLSGLVEESQEYDLDRLRILGYQADDSSRVVVPLKLIIEGARPHLEATHVTAASADGAYTASIPLEEALAKGELHVEPQEGASPPIRLQVPGGMTLCWNVKGLGRLKVTEGPEPDSLPEILTH